MKFKLSLLQETAAFLGLYCLLAIVFNLREAVFLHLAATLLWAGVLYWVFSVFTGKHKIVWNTLITAEILFLVLHPGSGIESVILALLATTFAISQKFFFEYKGSPVLNPVVFGVLAVSVLSALSILLESPFDSWWGAAFQGPLTLILMIAWMLYGVRRWRKGIVLLSFLASNALFMLLRGEPLDSLAFTYTDATIYFFAAIMIIEPKTSPVNNKEQAIYGGFAAGAYNLFLFFGLSHAALFALGAANLGKLFMDSRRRKSL